MKINVNYTRHKIDLIDNHGTATWVLLNSASREARLSQLVNILEEIFNRLDSSRLSSASPEFDIKLAIVSDEVDNIIGEW